MATRMPLAVLTIGLALVLMAATPAVAAPIWDIEVAASPTVAPGGDLTLLVSVKNVGDDRAPEAAGGDNSNCDPAAPPPADPSKCYRVTMEFPLGLTPSASVGNRPSGMTCSTAGQSLTCQAPGRIANQQVRARGEAGNFFELVVMATAGSDVSGPLTAQFAVEGAGASSDETVNSVVVSEDEPTFGIAKLDGQVTADAAGSPFTQAGGHPYAASMAFEVESVEKPHFFYQHLWPVEPLRNLIVDLPAGFVGDPTSVDRCTVLELAEGSNTAVSSLCPATSQVGVTSVRAYGFGDPASIIGPVPVYSMTPPHGVVARFGFNVLGTMVTLDAEVRSDSDYGVSIRARNTSQGLPIQGSEFTLWGDPSSADHDRDRACAGEGQPWLIGTFCSSGAPSSPLLRNPTRCTAPGTGLVTTARADSWIDSGDFDGASFESHEPPAYPSSPAAWGPTVGPENCADVPFGPSVDVRIPNRTAAGLPSGFEFVLKLPQSDDMGSVGTSDLRKAVVTLPRGLRVSPAAADGLGACSEREANLGSRDPAGCPPSSKIGELTIDTPLLDHRLEGGVYLAEQLDNPFDSLLALYLVVADPVSGINLTLPGKVEADQGTGQLTATFDDQPQLPFDRLHLKLKGGPRAPLMMPDTCGIYEVHAQLFPWARPNEPVTTTSEFTVDQGPNGSPCLAGDPSEPGDPADLADRPFDPTMTAGVENPSADSFSPFRLNLGRSSGDQELGGVDVVVPEGVTAKLAGVDQCSTAALNAISGEVGAGAFESAKPSCPVNSQIGVAMVGAGAGSSPYYVRTGKAYLAGPYKGAQLSIAVVVPALAGPFDLGSEVVRSKLKVNPRTAQVSVESDPLPQILHGIPLSITDLRVNVNREGFMKAPTNCDPMQIGATVQGSHGKSATLTNRFQVGDCGSLGFSPKLKLDFGNSKKATKRNQHPKLTAKLAFNEGDANISNVQVALPEGVFLDQERIGKVCSREAYAASSCPADSQVGYAKATTPLLDQPVEGPVYLKASDNVLPDLAADLNGQIDIDLFGRIDQREGKKVSRIQNTFDVVPDVPVSDFELTLAGGSDGLLVNSKNICKAKRTQKVSIDMVAHNEMTLSENPLIGSACKQINKKKAKKLKKKAKKLLAKAKKADSKSKAKKLRKQARKLKKQARKLGR